MFSHVELCQLPVDWKMPAQRKALEGNLSASHPCRNINHLGHAVDIADPELLKRYIGLFSMAELQGKASSEIGHFIQHAKFKMNETIVDILQGIL